jgi:hypothetical protein
MVRFSVLGAGLRYNVKVHAPGAQAERPGDARPVSALLGGENSLAAFSPLPSIHGCFKAEQ